MAELRKARQGITPGLLLTASLSLMGCDVVVGGLGGLEHLGTRASDVWTRTYTLEPGGQIQVVNINGKIEVEGTDGQSVEVKAERIVRATSDETAKEALKEIEIREEISGTRIRLETRLARRFGRTSREVRYHLRVPRTARVALENTNGGIEVVGLRGEVEAETTNGGVVGRDLESTVKASTTNGGLTIEMAAIGGAGVDLETTNGGISLRIPETAKADISARVTNGGISVSDLELEDVREKTRRRLEARVNGGGPRIALDTTNGGIRIGARQK